MMRRRLFTSAALIAASALTAARAWSQESAPFEVLEFEWADEKRQRAVPVRLYWPQPAS